MVRLLGVALVLAGCATAPGPGGPASESDPGARTRAVADDYFAAWLRHAPVAATFAGVPEVADDRLGDNSLPAERAWQEREDRWLAQLEAIDTVGLRGSPDEPTWAILHETLAASRASRVCRNELWPLSQLFGWQITFPVLAQLQPVGTPRARTEALARWRAVPRYIDTEIANLREGVQLGYVQPRANAEAVVEQLDAMLKFPAAESPLGGIAARDSTPAFRDSVVALVSTAILPAVRRYRDYLATEYVPRARTAIAVSALPHGAECYRALLREYTTLDLDPAALHRLGLEQMEAIEREMRPLAERSFGTTDLPSVMERLRSDPRYLLHSRDEVIRLATAAVDRARAAMPQWFGRLPKADVIADPCLPYEEKSGCPNSYVSATPDGSRPGRWRINAGVDPPQPRAPLEATAFHETIPGHHLQGAIAQEREGANPVTRYFDFSGYSEGWALYAERFAMDAGLYSSNVDRLGELSSQALRAARLVVDPGIHALGWSRDRAIEYMLTHTAESRRTVESEVDRYIAFPAQATSYMVGRLEIEALRDTARARLGSRFDLRTFHDRILEDGSVPLPLLRARVGAWVDSLARAAP